MRRIRIVAALATLSLLSVSPALADDPVKDEMVMLPDQVWLGDFDGMVERRMIRVLIPFSKMLYFLDGPNQRGISYETTLLFAVERGVQLVLLSASVANGDQVAEWLAAVATPPALCIHDDQRPVELVQLVPTEAGMVDVAADHPDLAALCVQEIDRIEAQRIESTKRARVLKAVEAGGELPPGGDAVLEQLRALGYVE